MSEATDWQPTIALTVGVVAFERADGFQRGHSLIGSQVFGKRMLGTAVKGLGLL